MGTPPISLCDIGEVDKSITLNVFFWIPSLRCRYLPYSFAEASEERVMHNSVIVTKSINTSPLCCGAI